MSKRFEIEIHKGAAPLRFGMSPEEARLILGVPFVSFKRTPASTFPCDFFGEIGLFIHYNASARIEALEFARPAEVVFQEDDLLGLSVSALVDRLRSIGKDVEVSSDGVTAYDVGIGAYVPDVSEDPDAIPEGVIVFVEGYYGAR